MLLIAFLFLRLDSISVVPCRWRLVGSSCNMAPCHWNTNTTNTRLSSPSGNLVLQPPNYHQPPPPLLVQVRLRIHLDYHASLPCIFTMHVSHQMPRTGWSHSPGQVTLIGCGCSPARHLCRVRPDRVRALFSWLRVEHTACLRHAIH